MRVDDRPSQNQEANKADQKKVKEKPSTKGTTLAQPFQKAMQGERTSQKKAFDDFLENFAAPGSGTTEKSDLPKQQMVNQVVERQDQKDRRQDQDQKDLKEKKETSGEKETHREGGVAGLRRDKIAAKKELGERQSGSDSRGGEHGRLFSAAKENPFKLKKSAAQESAPLAIPMAPLPPTQGAIPPEKLSGPRLTKTVLEEIVQWVRLGMNQHLGKEMEIQFKKDFFRGLKLKVSLKNGKVHVWFGCNHDKSVHQLMSGEKSTLQQLLLDKNIPVAEIVVEA